MKGKQRLSASVDAELIAAAEAAVAAGHAESVSAWVNAAMRRHREHEEHLRALDTFVEVFESEQGVIDAQEIRDATRKARKRATVVRGSKKKSA